jgi:methylmalonyl-CoA mutase cobalamin-binding subunit
VAVTAGSEPPKHDEAEVVLIKASKKKTRQEVTMSELIPPGLPKGMDLVREGERIGATFEVGLSEFVRSRNCSFPEWAMGKYLQGELVLLPQTGVSSVDEQVAALREIHAACLARGLDIGAIIVTSNMLNGLPYAKRKGAPRGTSFVMESPDDYGRILNASPILPVFADHMLGSPNSVFNTTHCLKAGLPYIGTFSQYVWDYPYWDDDVAHVSEVIKSLGIMKSKWEAGATVGSYVDDGPPASMIDYASAVGYVLLEQYVCETLCGARYSTGLGGLMSHIPSKMAVWMAIHEALHDLENTESAVGHIEGNTLDQTEDPNANWGVSMADFIPYAFLEQKYTTGAAYNPKPVMEALRVPTANEMIDVCLACGMAMKKIHEFREFGIIDDKEILKLGKDLADSGRKFFANTLNGLAEMGIDIRDPLQMLLAIRRLGGSRLEERFHPGDRDPSRYRGIVPVATMDLFKMWVPMAEKMIKSIHAEALGDAVRDKTFVMGSTDTHQFALFMLEKVFAHFGARVVNMGVDLDAEDALYGAAQENTPYILISTHNGICLDWGTRIMEEARKNGQEVRVYMGGKLNAILEGSAEPEDVTDRLAGIGIHPCADAMDVLRALVQEP